MGLGLVPKDQDFIDRTAATIERTQGSDAASRYASGQTDNGFADNYNAPAAAPAAQTDYSGADSFSDAFSEARSNLGAGSTFTYNGQSYSTAITGEDPALDAAIAAQQTPAPAPSPALSPEEQLMSQPVVTQDAQDYLDTLGTFEFDPNDFQTTEPSDPDALDPRGDQIESPTGTGIGQASTSVTDIQDTLDQIGGGAGTTIEDLLPPAADGGTTIEDMNFTERFERQSELADADPTGQSTATGTLLSDGSSVDTLVTTDPETGRPATFEATTIAGEDPVINKVTYSDSQGNTYDTLAEAQLSDAQDLNRQLTAIQNIPTETSYLDPSAPSRVPLNPDGSVQVTQAGFIPTFDEIKGALSPAFETITGAISDFDDRQAARRQSRKSVEEINAENQAAYEAEAFGPFGRDPATGEATPYFTLRDGTMVREDQPMGLLTGTKTGLGLADLNQLTSSAAKSLGEFVAKPRLGEVGPNGVPMLEYDPNFLTNYADAQLPYDQDLIDRQFSTLSAEDQANLTNPVFPEDGFVDFSALGAKTVRTLPSAAAAITNPIIAGGLTVGDVGLSSDQVIDAAVADGTLSGLGQGEIEAMKGEARRTNTIPAALIGTVSNLLPGRLGQNLLQRMGISAGEEFVQEGVFEPNIAQTSASTAGGFENEFQFDPEAGTVGALASGTASVATRGTAPNQAGGAGPNVMTDGPTAPVAPAASVISGQSLVPSTQADADAAMGRNVATNVQPTQPVAPSAEQMPSVINIPGTDVVVQAPAPAQPQAPNQGPPSGIEALGTGGAFRRPDTGTVAQLPAPSNVDAQPTVEQAQPTPPEVMSQAPEGLTAAEILQNEIDIITTDTNTTADQASQGPASIALIEAARNEGADVNVGDSRAEVSSKIVNQIASDNQAAAEEAMGRTLPDVDVGRINQLQQPSGMETLPNVDLTPAIAPEPAAPSLSDVDISRINQPTDLPAGIGSLDAAVAAARQNTTPEGIIGLEVAQTGALSAETARKVAEDNNLSMQDVANIAENAMGIEQSEATGPSTEVDVAATVDVVDATPGANQLAAEEAMGRGAAEFVFDGEVLSPTDTEVSTEVETPVEGDIIEGTVGSRDVAAVVDVPVDTSTTTPSTTDTTTRAPTTTTPETIRAVRSTDTAPRDEDDVVVEVDEPPADEPSGPGGPAQEDDVVVEVGAPTGDDDDDDETAEEAPFECPEGFEAVQINGEWRCQKIGDDTPKVGRMRPTGGAYYRPRTPSPAATAKAYRFR
jgi:hypothetical protein